MGAFSSTDLVCVGRGVRVDVTVGEAVVVIWTGVSITSSLP